MAKSILIGAAAVICTALAGPAMAHHVSAHPSHSARSADCASIESGNPFYRVREARSGWRAGDARNPVFSATRPYDGPDPLLPFGE
jgi:hypothetical protein